MYGVDLTPAESGRLLALIDAQRRYLERLHAWTVAVGMPADDPLRQSTRDVLLCTRELCLVIAGGLGKGELCKYKKSTRRWRAL